MSLAALSIRAAGALAARRLHAAARDPERAQAALLRAILQRNADTEYGAAHGFAEIATPAAYAQAVPIVEFADLEPYVARMMAGEASVLTAETPLRFARTSGTSGTPKHIPVTATCTRFAHRAPMRAWLHGALRDHPRCFSGSVLSLVSPAVEGHTSAGIPYGSTSGFVYREMPRIVSRAYLAPYALFEEPSAATRYRLLMRLGLADPRVSFIGTANPSSIIKLFETADEHSEALIAALHDGGWPRGLEAAAATREALAPRLRADPARAHELERLRSSAGGQLRPLAYWPQLKLIGCWKGGTVGTHLQRLERWLREDFRPAPAIRDWGWLSSEARGSVPLSDQGSAGVLPLAETYFEFLPADEVEADPDRPERARVLRPEELEVGVEYYTLLTTTGGLYRYDINDIVRCEGFHHRAPLIGFRRKGRGMTSITGEKVSVSQIVEAVHAAAVASGIRVDHFRVEADPREARYRLQVEGEPKSADEDAAERAWRALLIRFERALCTSNIEYAAKRETERLHAPRLEIMREGWYERRRAREVRAGARLFQAKTVLLTLSEEERAPAAPNPQHEGAAEQDPESAQSASRARILAEPPERSVDYPAHPEEPQP